MRPRFQDKIKNRKCMQRGTHLTVDRFSERVPSTARPVEVWVVHVGQKMGTADVEPVLDSPCDAIENCMNQIHSNVCHKADKQEKEAEELIEAHLKEEERRSSQAERVKRIGFKQRE